MRVIKNFTLVFVYLGCCGDGVNTHFEDCLQQCKKNSPKGQKYEAINM